MERKFKPYEISELYIYPIKSCHGISVESVEITPFGLKLDREFMIVEPENGMFITQREEPRLALVRVKIEEDRLVVSTSGMKNLEVLFSIKGAGDDIEVQVWHDRFMAQVHSQDASEWFSNFLGRKCLFVKMNKSHTRKVSKKYSISPENQVGFADAYPLHMTTHASLSELNKSTKSEVPMTRFRANIVLLGKFAYEEDIWGQVRIGELDFTLVKACNRCGITTIDQETAKRNDNEPLAALARTRITQKGLRFGQYAICHSLTGTIKLGTEVELVKQK